MANAELRETISAACNGRGEATLRTVTRSAVTSRLADDGKSGEDSTETAYER
jgi:hypothetical protein